MAVLILLTVSAEEDGEAVILGKTTFYLLLLISIIGRMEGTFVSILGGLRVLRTVLYFVIERWYMLRASY